MKLSFKSEKGLIWFILPIGCALVLFLFIIIAIPAFWGLKGQFGGGTTGGGGAGGTYGPIATTDILDGYSLPVTSGKICTEQHLALTAGESAQAHYQNTNCPADCQNGMAGGSGPWGAPIPKDNEIWYCNMRWNYGTWIEVGGGSRPRTKCIDINTDAFNWHKYKKVIITYNGKSVVCSICESGPAIWTKRVAGATLEVMKALGTSCDSECTYAWVKDQTTTLGPVK